MEATVAQQVLLNMQLFWSALERFFDILTKTVSRAILQGMQDCPQKTKLNRCVGGSCMTKK